MLNKNIGIFGATGLIGSSILRSKLFEEYHFKVFSRNLLSAKEIFKNCHNVSIIPDDKLNNLEDCEVVINLAGASMGGKRWNKTYKMLILNSRIDSTRNIVLAIITRKIRLRKFINASAIGIYGFRKDEFIDESSSSGNDYLANLCTKWENELTPLSKENISTISLRTGIVLSENGGALEKFMLPFKFYIGGHQGKGNQWISWIHIEDLISIIHYVINNDDISGPVNCTSPNPVTNKEFSKTLGKVLRKPSVFSVPSFILKIVLGEFSTSILNGQRVLPEKLIQSGYKFKYPILNHALENLLL